jgi:hypothetical protein
MHTEQVAGSWLPREDSNLKNLSYQMLGLFFFTIPNPNLDKRGRT